MTIPCLTFCAGYVSESESDVSDLAEEIVLNVIGDDEGGGGEERTRDTGTIVHPKDQVGPETAVKTARKAYSLNRAASLSSVAEPRVKKSKSVRFSVSPVPPPSTQPAPPTSTAPPPLPATPIFPTVAAATTTTGTTITTGFERKQPVATSQEKLSSTLSKQLVPSSNKVVWSSLCIYAPIIIA